MSGAINGLAFGAGAAAGVATVGGSTRRWGSDWPTFGVSLGTAFGSLFMGLAADGRSRALGSGAGGLITGAVLGVVGGIILNEVSPRADKVGAAIEDARKQAAQLQEQISTVRNEIESSERSFATQRSTLEAELERETASLEQMIAKKGLPGPDSVGALRIDISGKTPAQAAEAYFSLYDDHRDDEITSGDESVRTHGRDTFSAARLVTHVDATYGKKNNDVINAEAMTEFFAKEVDTGGIGGVIEAEEASLFNRGPFAELHTRAGVTSSSGATDGPDTPASPSSDSPPDRSAAAPASGVSR